jgi:hypothetical protein
MGDVAGARTRGPDGGASGTGKGTGVTAGGAGCVREGLLMRRFDGLVLITAGVSPRI